MTICGVMALLSLFPRFDNRFRNGLAHEPIGADNPKAA